MKKILKKIFYKTVPVKPEIKSFLRLPVTEDSDTKQVIDWAVSGGIGAVGLAVLIASGVALFL